MASDAVGFVGLGEMGFGMAKNLARKGFTLNVFDIRPEPLQELKALGATPSSTLKEMARNSRFIITMVRDTTQTDAVLFGKDGVWEGLQPGSVIIIASTLDPFYCRNLEERAREKKVSVLDACVSGAKMKAEAGTLTLICGGEKAVFEKCKPILDAMGKEIYFMGGVGTGQTTKLANNLMLHVNMEAATEAIALAVSAGINIDEFLDVVKKSTGNSWIIENWHFIAQKKRELRDNVPGNTFANSMNLIDACLKIGRTLKLKLPALGLISQTDEGNGPFNRIEEETKKK